MRGAEGRLSTDDIEELWDMAGGACMRCCTQESLEVDHIVPVILGGRNELANVQLLCTACNQLKRIRAVDFRKRPCTDDFDEIDRFARRPKPIKVEVPTPRTANPGTLLIDPATMKEYIGEVWGLFPSPPPTESDLNNLENSDAGH